MDGEAPSSNTQSTVSTGALEHGGRLDEARRLFPGAPEPFLDLSTGINPVPYPVRALPPEIWARLPEPPALAALQAAAAFAYRAADPAMLVAAPGTQILISLLPALLPYRHVAILGPTYGEHRAAWQRAGAQISESEHVAALAGHSCAILCNPNNPDGRRHEPATLLAVADDLASRGGLLIVDEAFADFDPAISLVPSLPHPALLILRSFGKAYGLAGLRMGFALAAPPLADRVRTALGPWAVSGPACRIGTLALHDRAWLDTASARLERDAARLDFLLHRAGLQVLGGTRLFRLARAQPPGMFDRLGRAGILVRRFAEHEGWLRFGLPADQPAWERLANTLLA